MPPCLIRCLCWGQIISNRDNILASGLKYHMSIGALDARHGGPGTECRVASLGEGETAINLKPRPSKTRGFYNCSAHSTKANNGIPIVTTFSSVSGALMEQLIFEYAALSSCPMNCTDFLRNLISI